MPPILDRAEFGRLFQEHARLLWVVAASRVSRDAAQDVVQEAAMIALTQLDRFTPGTDFRAWMAQIVRFAASNAARRSKKGPRALDSVASLEAHELVRDAIDVGGQLLGDQSAFDDELVAALTDLTDDARAALLLRVVLELSYAEIATTLGLPEGTVASHVHRARESLRHRLAVDRPVVVTRRAHP